MRPLPGDDALERSRRASFADNDPTPIRAPFQHASSQMTYFVADEKTMEESQSAMPNMHNVPSLHKYRESPKGSTYGVESIGSIGTTISSSMTQASDDLEERHNWRKNNTSTSGMATEDRRAGTRCMSPKSSTVSSRNASPSLPRQRRMSQQSTSRPLTPLYYGSTAPGSIISSPGSRRDSIAGSSYLDDLESQAVASSEDDLDRDVPTNAADGGSPPQLVMPSIQMPSRRPFTENGKNLGRLKVLVAGDSGVGKTSLIKAIVQICEDIVHVDPIPTTSSSHLDLRRRNSRAKSKNGVSEIPTTSQVTEVFASTRAYPCWWSDLDESQILRRRKSMGGSVLERNLCFVDTPGYGNTTSCLDAITPVINYVESSLSRIASPEQLSDSDTISMLSGNGGFQVDVVFYVIMQRLKPVDLEYLSRLAPLTNVIPLIAQSDTLTSEQISSLKVQIRSELESAGIRPFNLSQFATLDSQQFPTYIPSPYAISTATTTDHETMDASLLMSPDYIQPLAQSELQPLIAQIFQQDTISWLRHSAAKKYIDWRDNSSAVSKPQSLYRPLMAPPSAGLTGPVGATTSYALARITDHTQREERLAQIRLANWAADLQRSLQNERLRYEELARNERAVWLTERLGECVADGTIVPISKSQNYTQNSHSRRKNGSSSKAMVRRGYCGRSGRASGIMSSPLNPHDPLGLVQLNEDIKRRGWIAFQVVSSVGIIGGLAIWLSRGWKSTDSDAWLLGNIGLLQWG
ncbi:Septin-domain-containing protein [Xylogone sp. PMI_703]|nr:Septin-domain-containing protein [Xylogone sp. PMI_703]